MTSDNFIYPFCWPVDYLHLAFMNTMKNLFLMYRGKFFDGQKNAGSNATSLPVNKETTDAEGGGVDNLRPKTRGVKVAKFPGVDYANWCRETGEDYVPSKDIWSQIFKDMDESRKDFPTKFGKYVNFSRVANCSKAATWEVWAFRQSPVYMRKALNKEHYNQYRKFLIAIEMAGRNEISKEGVDRLEKLMEDWLEYYERTMYRYDFDRLGACLPSIHQNGHLGHTIRMMGPLSAVWQFPDEDVMRELGTATSPLYPNEALTNMILMMEQIKMFPYCLPDIGIGKGGVAGLGLDAIGEDIKSLAEGSTENFLVSNGKLKFVRLFALFKTHVDLRYKALGGTIPGTDLWNEGNITLKKRMKLRRQYEHQTINSIIQLPAYYNSGSDLSEQSSEEDCREEEASAKSQKLDDYRNSTKRAAGHDRINHSPEFQVVPPTNMDLQMLHFLDFEGDEFMLDGERRPFVKVYQEGHGSSKKTDNDKSGPKGPDNTSRGIIDKENESNSVLRIIRLYEPILNREYTKNNRKQKEDLSEHADREELTLAQKTLLLKFFDDHNMVPHELVRSFEWRTSGNEEEQFQILEKIGMDPIKWKALKISRFGTGRKGVGSGWRDGLRPVKVVGRENGHPNRERNASRIQYLDHPLSEATRSPDSKFGEILFFLSVENPETLYRDSKKGYIGKHPRNEPIDDDGRMFDNGTSCKTQEMLILALVEIIKTEYTSDRFLLRVVKNREKSKARGREGLAELVWVDARCLHGLIGLLTSTQKQYLVWEDNCWTTFGSSVLLD